MSPLGGAFLTEATKGTKEERNCNLTSQIEKPDRDRESIWDAVGGTEEHEELEFEGAGLAELHCVPKVAADKNVR